MKKVFLVGLFTVLLMALVYGLSWIIICGVVKLITICFGLEFSWAIATGIWLVLFIARWVFGGKSSSK